MDQDRVPRRKTSSHGEQIQVVARALQATALDLLPAGRRPFVACPPDDVAQPKGRRPVRRLVAATGLAFVLALFASAAPAALARSDREDLTRALRILADGPEHSAAARATAVLRDSAYGRADFEDFFGSFFARDALTPALKDVLASTALGAPSPATRRTLQEALAAVLVSEIESTLERNLPDRPGRNLRNSVTFMHLGSSMRLLGLLAYRGDGLSRTSRVVHYDRLRRLVASHPGILRKDVTIDTRRYPHLASIRAHLYKNLRDLESTFDPAAFVADTGFSGRYAELVIRYGLVVLDNNGFTDWQLQAIQDLLALIPAGLHRATHISQHALLGNFSRGRVELPFEGGPGVNIFALKLARTQNQFPRDADPMRAAVFCSVLQHELNHLVDTWAIHRSPVLSRRRDDLIVQAGSNPMQYLRSMLPHGYFGQHPQEFFASIANMYLTSSLRTLRLAEKRLARGWRQPINQFLFFAEVYSQGGSHTLFFEQDQECHFSATAVPVGRDAAGRIDRISWPGGKLQFDLDATGDVRWRRGAAARADAPLADLPQPHATGAQGDGG